MLMIFHLPSKSSTGFLKPFNSRVPMEFSRTIRAYERCRHQQFTSLLAADVLDPADHVDVRANQREIETAAGVDIAVADFAIMLFHTG
jgi:hypothetical protein